MDWSRLTVGMRVVLANGCVYSVGTGRTITVEGRVMSMFDGYKCDFTHESDSTLDVVAVLNSWGDALYERPSSDTIDGLDSLIALAYDTYKG